MNPSVTEVNSLEVSEIIDVPRVLKLAVVVGLHSDVGPAHTLEETARYLKTIGLESRVLPTSSISYIEQQAFAKLRQNPKIREMYRLIFGLKPEASPRRSRNQSQAAPEADQPSALANRLASDMAARRRFAKLRKAS